jgi:hypothetical protein
MGKGKKATDAKVFLFKRLYGVKPDIFENMMPFLQRGNTMLCTRTAGNRPN